MWNKSKIIKTLEKLRDFFDRGKKSKQSVVSNLPEYGIFEKEQVIRQGRNIAVKVVGKIDLEALNQRTKPEKKSKRERKMERLQQKIEMLQHKD